LDAGRLYHKRINHAELFADKYHINSMESFENQFKIVLRKYDGIDKNYLYFVISIKYIMGLCSSGKG